jgi:hypothetical protein
MTDVPAHDQARTLHEIAAYPPHGPRETDPNYATFHAARHHLIDVLGVGCWIGGATKAQIAAGLPEEHLCHGATGLEAHHHVAEFAGLNEIDWQKVAADFPQLGIHSDADFLRMAESDGGLLILCSKHHRAPYHGIHSITEPVWKLDRYARVGWEFQGDPVATPPHGADDAH